jgi:hypothetical protein
MITHLDKIHATTAFMTSTTSPLGKLAEFALVGDGSDLGLDGLLGGLALSSLFDLFLQLPRLLRLERLYERIDLGQLLFDRRSGSRTGLEVVGFGDDGGDGLLPLLQVLLSCLPGLFGSGALLLVLSLLGLVGLLLLLQLFQLGLFSGLALGEGHGLSTCSGTGFTGSSLLSFPGGLFFLPESLDSGVGSENHVDHLTDTGVVLLLGTSTLGLVLLFLISLLVTTANAQSQEEKATISKTVFSTLIPLVQDDSRIASLVDLLVPHLERPPAVKVVPEVVELFDIVLFGIVVPEAWYGLGLAESGFSGEYGAVGGDCAIAMTGEMKVVKPSAVMIMSH